MPSRDRLGMICPICQQPEPNLMVLGGLEDPFFGVHKDCVEKEYHVEIEVIGMIKGDEL